MTGFLIALVAACVFYYLNNVIMPKHVTWWDSENLIDVIKGNTKKIENN